MQIRIIGIKHNQMFIGIDPSLFLCIEEKHIIFSLDGIKFPSSEIESITYDGYFKTRLYDSEAMKLFKELKSHNPEIQIEEYKTPKRVL